jgi:hypothetical protein
MIRILITVSAVFVIAIPTTVAGRGGGDFYVPALVAAGESMHQAPTTGQLILLLVDRVEEGLIVERVPHGSDTSGKDKRRENTDERVTPS